MAPSETPSAAVSKVSDGGGGGGEMTLSSLPNDLIPLVETCMKEGREKEAKQLNESWDGFSEDDVHLEPTITTSIWDFGGHPELQTIQQMFLMSDVR